MSKYYDEDKIYAFDLEFFENDMLIHNHPQKHKIKTVKNQAPINKDFVEEFL